MLCKDPTSTPFYLNVNRLPCPRIPEPTGLHYQLQTNRNIPPYSNRECPLLPIPTHIDRLFTVDERACIRPNFMGMAMFTSIMGMRMRMRASFVRMSLYVVHRAEGSCECADDD